MTQTADLGVVAVQFDEDGEWQTGRAYPKNIVVPWKNAMWGSTRAMAAGEEPGLSSGWAYLCGSAPLGAMRIQSYLSAGTFTWNKPDNLLFIMVDVIGAGGGVGGTWADGGGFAVCGAPSGGLARKCISADGLQESEMVTVGAGGAAGPKAANSAGGAGGTSSFGVHCSATGGSGVGTYDQRGLAAPWGAGAIGKAGGGIGGHLNINGRRGMMTLYINGYSGSHGQCGQPALYGNLCGCGADGYYTIGASVAGAGARGRMAESLCMKFWPGEDSNGRMVQA